MSVKGYCTVNLDMDRTVQGAMASIDKEKRRFRKKRRCHSRTTIGTVYVDGSIKFQLNKNQRSVWFLERDTFFWTINLVIHFLTQERLILLMARFCTRCRNKGPTPDYSSLLLSASFITIVWFGTFGTLRYRMRTKRYRPGGILTIRRRALSSKIAAPFYFPY